MDLAVGARAVWVIMEHNTRKGAPRLVEACTLPLTGKACVTRVYTDLAVVEVTPAGFLVREVLEGMTREELQAAHRRAAHFRAGLPAARRPRRCRIPSRHLSSRALCPGSSMPLAPAHADVWIPVTSPGYDSDGRRDSSASKR